MTTLPVIPNRRICAACAFWVPNYVGPQTVGWCVWRETKNKPRRPNLNVGSKFTVFEDGRLLETHWDASCLQFEAK